MSKIKLTHTPDTGWEKFEYKILGKDKYNIWHTFLNERKRVLERGKPTYEPYKERIALAKEHGYTGREAKKVARDLYFAEHIDHCNSTEYFMFDFYHLKRNYRRDFALVWHQCNIFMPVNNGNLYGKFKPLYQLKKIKKMYNNHQKTIMGDYEDKKTGKQEIYKKFPEMVSRKYICTWECEYNELLEFVKCHDKVIFKPNHGSLGKGIFTYCYKNEPQRLPEIFMRGKMAHLVCEEFIIQHPTMAKFNESSVNTVRVYTFKDDQKVHFLGAFLKSGSIGMEVDNLSAGGLAVQVDVETGITNSIGKDYGFNSFMRHPVTGMILQGIQVPNWELLKDSLIKAYDKLNIRIIGWDIAITENGIELVEYNNRPGTKMLQLFDKIPKGKVIIDYYNKIKHNKQ